MQASNAPSRIQLPFATSGTRNTIPVASQIGVLAGAASYTDGFPPLTFTPPTAGGVPPFGADFNGLFYAITAIQQWQSAGGLFTYNAAWSTANNGYPKGAVLVNSSNDGFWLNKSENNTTDPDSVANANWTPIANYGVSSISGLTNANVTLTPAQFKNPIITLAGALTGNIQIIVPTNYARFLVFNNTTGGFTATFKTAAGSGVPIPQGGSLEVYGDGTSIGVVNRYALNATPFDNSQFIATTAFCTQMGIQSSGLTMLSGAVSLGASYAGGTAIYNANGVTNFTLPAANSYPVGGRLELMNIDTTGTAVFACTGSDHIVPNESTLLTSVTLGTADTMTLLGDGVSKWYPVGGSMMAQYSAAYTVAFGSSNAQARVKGFQGVNNGTTPLTKFDMQADAISVRNSSGVAKTLYNVGTVTCDTGLAGSAANGRDQSAAFSSQVWLHFYFIYNGTTIATLVSTTAPSAFDGTTLPSGYTYWVYATTIWYNSSFNLVSVNARGEGVYPVNGEVNPAISGDTSTGISLAISQIYVPPNALTFDATLRMRNTTSSTMTGALAPANPADSVHGSGVLYSTPAGTGVTEAYSQDTFTIPNVSQTLYVRTSTALTGSNLTVLIRNYRVANGDA